MAEQGLEAQLTATASRAGKTSAADWLQRGATFFEEKLWPLAEMSYLRGGDKALALRAGAARLFAEARAAPARAESCDYTRAVTMRCVRVEEERGHTRSGGTVARVRCSALPACGA